MAKFSFSRPDSQARLSAVLSLLSCVTLAGLVFLMKRHLDWKQMVISYGRTRGLIIQATFAVTLLLAASGTYVGWSSVGERRNDKPTLSWLGFFVGAAVISLAFILYWFFKSRGELMVY